MITTSVEWISLIVGLFALLTTAVAVPLSTSHSLRKEIGSLRTEMTRGNESLRAAMTAGDESLRTAMTAGDESLRTEISSLRAETGATRTELREELRGLSTEVKKELRSTTEQLKGANARIEDLAESVYATAPTAS